MIKPLSKKDKTVVRFDEFLTTDIRGNELRKYWIPVQRPIASIPEHHTKRTGNYDLKEMMEVGRLQEAVKGFENRLMEIRKTQSIYEEVTWSEIKEAVDEWLGGIK